MQRDERPGRYAKQRGAVAINRVEIADETVDEATRRKRPWDAASDLDAIQEAARKAPQKHHGFDCFIWRADLTPLVRIAVGNLAVGCESTGATVGRDSIFSESVTASGSESVDSSIHPSFIRSFIHSFVYYILRLTTRSLVS